MHSSNESVTIFVLLVEDERSWVGAVQRVVGELHRSLGSQFELELAVVGSLNEAMMYLQDHRVDATLLDLSLPDAHGVEAISRIVECYPSVPILVFSNLTDHSSLVRFAQAGASDTVKKNGLETAELFRAVFHAFERKRVEDSLGESRALYRTLVENLPIGIFRKNIDGRYTFANRAFCVLVGLEHSDVSGKDDTYMFSSQSVGVIAAIDRRVMDEHTSVDEEVSLVLRNGTTIIVRLGAMPIDDASMETLGVQGALMDTSRQHLRHEQEIAIGRFEGARTLAYNVLHRVRNRLGPIAMNAAMLRSEPLCKSAVDLVGEIEEGIAGASRTLDHLSWSDESSDLSVGPIDLDIVVNEVVDQLRRKTETDIDWSVHFAAQLPRAQGILANTRTIFEALLVNSIEGFDSNDRRISIIGSVGPREAGASPGAQKEVDCVVLEIRDSGAGIPSEIRGKVFDPYFTTKDESCHEGMGLTNCMTLVHQMSGSIRLVDTSSDTCFEVVLPTWDGQVEKKERYQATGNGELILLVDDEQQIRKTGKMFLEDNGYSVVTAENGAAAITLFQERLHEIKLVITDLVMPYVDGGALVVALRDIRADVPIVLTTGLHQSSDMTVGPNGQSLPCLKKPFDPTQFLTVVETALGTHEL